MFSLHKLRGLQDAHPCFLPSSVHVWLSLASKDRSTALWCHFQCDFPLLKLALPPVLTAPMKPAAGLELHYGEAQLAGSRDSLWSIASTHQQSDGLGSSVFLVDLKVIEAPSLGWTTTWELWRAGPRSPQQSCELICGFAQSTGGTFAGQQ